MVKNRIGVLRKELGMNQKELGMKLGVGQTTVSAWETGKNEPDAESLHRMANLFHVSIGYLTGYENSQRRGLSEAEYAAYEEMRDAERQENPRQPEESGLSEAEIAELIRDANMEDWGNSKGADTIEGHIASRIIDQQPVEVRKWLLDGIKLFTSGPNN